MTLALVILAAGASTRLGAVKALVDLDGRTPLERLMTAGRALGPATTLVVGGAHARELGAWLAASPFGADVRFLEHAGWRRGRLGSVAAAAEALPGLDLALAPVDVPLVEAATFEALGAGWAAAGHPAEGWLAPRHGTAFGHPVVVGRDLAARTLALDPAAPLRDLRVRAQPLLAVAVRDPAVLDDLDTPADLARLRGRLSAGSDRGGHD